MSAKAALLWAINAGICSDPTGREQISLQVIALEVMQAHGLRFSLNAFCNNRVPQSVRHVDDRLAVSEVGFIKEPSILIVAD